MIALQLSSKAINKLPKQRSFNCQNYWTYRNEHQLFDKNPHRKNPTSVNRSMLHSLHRNLPFQALDTFKRSTQLGFIQNIDQVTISLALKACKGNPFLSSQIHGFAVTSGFGSYIIVCNSLINYYCKYGQFRRALCIFESLDYPDVVSWNTVLSGFQRCEDAQFFARRMHSSGVVFDAVSYTTLLAFCSRHEEFLFGLQLHSCIEKCGLDCEVFVGNALITMYSRWGRLVEARRVFEEMPNRDLVSWGAMISGYTQEGSHGLDAIWIFIEMVREGLELDHVSFTSAVSACGHERNLELGKQIHGLSIKRGYWRHISVGNVLISTYSKCDVPEDAKLVFKLMDDRNVVSWTSIITVNKDDAVSLFNEMRFDGVCPNEVTFVGLLHAITLADLVAEGRTVHGLCVKTGFSSQFDVCNSLITMYAKFESMQDSEKVFEELNYKEIIAWNALISGYAQNHLFQYAIQAFCLALTEYKPTEYTFGSVLNAIGAAEDISLKHGQRCHSHIIKLGLDSDPIVSGALLDMYAKRGSIHESQSVFADMPQRGQFAWTTMISAYARHGDYDLVMNWFEEMKKEGVKPDSITFLSVLAACGRKGMVDMGRHLFDAMLKDYQIEPFPEHYSCMVDMLGRAGRLEEAEELVNQIPGGPGLTVLQSLLGACRIYGNVEMGERAVDALLEMEPTESGSYVLMSNLYAEKGHWEKVAKVRKGMRDKGVRKEIGFSWVDVGNIYASLSLHGFSSGDMSHPQAEEICSMAEYIGLEMKFWRERGKDEEHWEHSFL